MVGGGWRSGRVVGGGWRSGRVVGGGWSSEVRTLEAAEGEGRVALETAGC